MYLRYLVRVIRIRQSTSPPRFPHASALSQPPCSPVLAQLKFVTVPNLAPWLSFSFILLDLLEFEPLALSWIENINSTHLLKHSTLHHQPIQSKQTFQSHYHVHNHAPIHLTLPISHAPSKTNKRHLKPTQFKNNLTTLLTNHNPTTLPPSRKPDPTKPPLQPLLPPNPPKERNRAQRQSSKP